MCLSLYVRVCACMCVVVCVPASACGVQYVCGVCLSLRVLNLSPRLDTIVGPPQTLSGKAKTFSSPSLHLYYSQTRRKHSAPGSGTHSTLQLL